MSSDEMRRRAHDYGTEADKKTCSFYYKTGACRHGPTCTRVHDKPSSSKVVLIPHMYLPPQDKSADEEAAFEDFVEDVLDEATQFGHIKELVVTYNTCDHMLGNCYIAFSSESSANKLVQKWYGRLYNGLQLYPELSPISITFEESRCKQFDKGKCERGGACNFIHIRVMPHWLRMRLYDPESYFDLIHIDPALGKDNLKDQLYPDHMARRSLQHTGQSISSDGKIEVRTSAPQRALAESLANSAFQSLEMNQSQPQQTEASNTAAMDLAAAFAQGAMGASYGYDYNQNPNQQATLQQQSPYNPTGTEMQQQYPGLQQQQGAFPQQPGAFPQAGAFQQQPGAFPQQPQQQPQHQSIEEPTK